MTHQLESLNLWDRLFNRTRREIADRGTETWVNRYTHRGVPVGDTTSYQRDWVDYRVIDRLTGSVTIEREYLN